MAAAPRFFETRGAFRAWLRTNHRTASEVFVGYFKRHTGRPGMTWPESVGAALCFGWIDGIRRRIDDDRYVIRFTPRRRGSRWSAVNVRMMAALIASGEAAPAGRDAFEVRADPASQGYSAEKKQGALDGARLRALKKNKSAWAFFGAQPP